MHLLGIFQTIGMFAKCVLHADSCVFHWFMDSPVSLMIFLLTPCSSIVLNIHECGTES